MGHYMQSKILQEDEQQTNNVLVSYTWEVVGLFFTLRTPSVLFCQTSVYCGILNHLSAGEWPPTFPNMLVNWCLPIWGSWGKFDLIKLYKTHASSCLLVLDITMQRQTSPRIHHNVEQTSGKPHSFHFFFF